MANQKHLEILSEGVDAWNNWRRHELGIKPDLEGVDLSARQLQKINFSDTNLSNANFENAELEGAIFTNANLRGAVLKKAKMSEKREANKASSSNRILPPIIHTTNFCKADLRGADLSDADLTKANLNNANLSAAVLVEVHFQSANLQNAIFEDANLRKAFLVDAILVGANLKKANVTEANCNGANMEMADLTEVDFTKSDLQKTNLRGAILENTDFTEVRFSGCNIDNRSVDYNVRGCLKGVNGFYSVETDSSALIQWDPPGHSMQGSNADAIVDSLKHSRKLHTTSFALGCVAIIVCIQKPINGKMPKIKIPIFQSIEVVATDYLAISVICSVGLLALTYSFLHSALDGMQYLNDRSSVMKVSHFPWMMTKYEQKIFMSKISKIVRLALSFHPVMYLLGYMIMLPQYSNTFYSYFPSSDPILLVFNVFMILVYLIILFICVKTYQLSCEFQIPVLFDPLSESTRLSDLEKLTIKIEEVRQLVEKKMK